VIAAYNPIAIVHMARKLSSNELDVLGELVAEGLADGVQGGIFLVFDRKELTGGIDPNVRAFFEKMTRERADDAGLSAVVILSDGFAGALLRGVVAGLAQLTRRRGKIRVFGEVGDACRALAEAHGIDPVELLRAYESAIASP